MCKLSAHLQSSVRVFEVHNYSINYSKVLDLSIVKIKSGNYLNQKGICLLNVIMELSPRLMHRV